MSDQKHTTKAKFIAIWLILAVLTAIEVFVPQMFQAEWDYNIKAGLLVILACAKAALVGYFFMHLVGETKWVRRIALVPVYIGLVAIVLMFEVAFR